VLGHRKPVGSGRSAPGDAPDLLFPDSCRHPPTRPGAGRKKTHDVPEGLPHPSNGGAIAGFIRVRDRGPPGGGPGRVGSPRDHRPSAAVWGTAARYRHNGTSPSVISNQTPEILPSTSFRSFLLYSSFMSSLCRHSPPGRPTYPPGAANAPTRHGHPVRGPVHRPDARVSVLPGRGAGPVAHGGGSGPASGAGRRPRVVGRRPDAGRPPGPGAASAVRCGLDRHGPGNARRTGSGPFCVRPDSLLIIRDRPQTGQPQGGARVGRAAAEGAGGAGFRGRSAVCGPRRAGRWGWDRWPAPPACGKYRPVACLLTTGRPSFSPTSQP